MTHSKNWTLLLNLFIRLKDFFVAQRIDFFFEKLCFKGLNLFLHDSKNVFFLTWLKELNLLLNIRPSRIEPLFFSMTQRIEPFFWIWFTELNPFVKFDSKNWTFFEKNRLKELNFLKWFKELNPFFSIWLKELNFPFYMSQRFEPCYMTQRLDPFYKVWPPRIEPFEKYDSKKWTSFFCTTHRIELFWICLNELNPFFKCDSNSWTFFEHDAKHWTLFLLNMTRRIETFQIWLKELKLFWDDS